MSEVASLMAKARDAHIAGRITDAERMYRDVLAKTSLNAEAWRQLGVALFQQGNASESVQCLQRAVELAPDDEVAWSSLAVALREAQLFTAAIQAAERSVALAPADILSIRTLAQLYEDAGRLRQAAEIIAQTAHLHSGTDTESLYASSIELFLRCGDSDRALSEAHRAVLAVGVTSSSLRLLAAVLEERKDCTIEALLLRQLTHQTSATDSPRRLAEIFASQSHVLASLGQTDLAVSCLQQCLSFAPEDESSRARLALFLHKQGRTLAAVQTLRASPVEDPVRILARESNVACLLTESEQLDEAASAIEHALRKAPASAPALAILANIHARRARHHDARVVYEQARRLDLSIPLWLEATASPLIIPDSRNDIDEWRKHFNEQLQLLERCDLVLHHPLTECGLTNFYLAYHGHDNLDFHSRWSGLVSRLFPSISWEAPDIGGCRSDERTKIGFVSAHFFQHSISKTTLGLIEKLDRAEFEVVVLFVNRRSEDPVAKRITDSADSWFDVPSDLIKARELVAKLRLDVLYYPDIGMESFTYYLAHARLAPVQCTSFGHPDTTGIPSVDYFISTALLEPPDAGSQYAERLELLPTSAIPSFYYAPSTRLGQLTRDGLSIAAGCHLYLCPQTMFKLHPDMDEIFVRILEKDPRAELVLLAAERESWTEKLKTRLRRTVSPSLARIHILPRLAYPDFLSLLAAADVILDTVHFNGMNTTLESLCVGTPVVCMRGTHQRSRHSAALASRCGLTTLVAETVEDYVQLAVALASDSPAVVGSRNEIRHASRQLFSDRSALIEFGNLIHDLRVRHN